MPARAAVRSLLGTDPEMQALGWRIEQIFSPDAVDSQERDQRWAVLVWEGDTAPFPGHAADFLEVWLYQPRQLGRDYGVIDLGLLRVRELLTAAEQVPGEDGWTLTSATYRSGSRDLPEEASESLVRYCRFHVASRYVVTA